VNDRSAHPPYVTSIDEIAWGIMLVAITLVMHGFGMLLAQEFQAQQMQRLNQRREKRKHKRAASSPQPSDGLG
jgi:hypothetical protein